MGEYNYGPLEHELAGGTFAECTCHKFIRLHDGHCNVHGFVRRQQPSHEQPASAPVSEWSYSYDGDRYHIRVGGNSDCVAHADKLKDAERIINDHNQHQHCATQFQYLGNRAEELSSLLAGMTTERDGLRAMIRKYVDYYEGNNAARLGNGQARRSLDEFRAALSHAEQGEGS